MLNGAGGNFSAITMAESQAALSPGPRDQLTSINIASLPLSFGAVELSSNTHKPAWTKAGRFSTVRMMSTLTQNPQQNQSYRKYLKNGYETQRLVAEAESQSKASQ